MNDYIKRMKDEFIDLEGRAEKLNLFITQSPIFLTVHPIEQNRLKAQCLAMNSYLKVLGSRLNSSQGFEAVECVTFGIALEAAKLGKKIKRKGWNGKGQFVIKAGGYKVVEARPGSDYAKAGIEGEFNISPHLDLKNAQGDMQPGWVPSQGDLFADDWVIL